ncbi:MAG: GNAT family N-acetyltransferase [Phycisphaerales bacterium]|nr:MAG: GNAT family N-acetyltransferase [Phycisphaerales bacterium]
MKTGSAGSTRSRGVDRASCSGLRSPSFLMRRTQQAEGLNGPLHMRFALPDDPDLDAFVSGNEEVDAYFRARQWFNVAKGVSAPPTYQFLTERDGDVVGYASVAFRRSDHPFDGSDKRALYLLIYVIGIHKRFQGQRNARGSNESYAASMIRMLANLASGRDDCVGLGLWVREDNARAIAFYQKVGFEPDPGGA